MENKLIIYTQDNGSLALLIPNLDCGLTIEEIANKDVPKEKEYFIVNESEIPEDHIFLNAWVINNGVVEHDLSKTKIIAHEKRRAKRDQEFAPFDEIIMKQIPNKNLTETETFRQAIREKYSVIQEKIDAATSAEELKKIIEEIK